MYKLSYTVYQHIRTMLLNSNCVSRIMRGDSTVRLQPRWVRVCVASTFQIQKNLLNPLKNTQVTGCYMRSAPWGLWVREIFSILSLSTSLWNNDNGGPCVYTVSLHCVHRQVETWSIAVRPIPQRQPHAADTSCRAKSRDGAVPGRHADPNPTETD